MDIPDFIEVDVSDLNIGDSLRVSDLKIVENIRILSDANRTVASVTAPAVEQEPEKVEEVEEVAAEAGEEKPGEEESAPTETQPSRKDGKKND